MVLAIKKILLCEGQSVKKETLIGIQSSMSNSSHGSFVSEKETERGKLAMVQNDEQ